MDEREDGDSEGSGEVEEQQEQTQWGIGSIIKEVDERIRGLRLPKMMRATGLDEPYTFPSNAYNLSSEELGSLQLKLSALYSIVLSELGKEESELGGILSVYEINLGVRMQKIADGYSGRGPNKDNQKALAIDGDERLKRLTRIIIKKQMTIRKLEAQSAIYHEQLTRLSREQSRRESEAKFG